MNDKHLDCVVIGYNELPFERYENFLRNYGEDSEAYRDLKFSFVNLGGKKLDYTGLLNYAHEQSHPAKARCRCRFAHLSVCRNPIPQNEIASLNPSGLCLKSREFLSNKQS